MNLFKKKFLLFIINFFFALSAYASKDLVVIPFDYNEYGHIIVEVTINGDNNRLKFIFDTGGANLINTGSQFGQDKKRQKINSIRIGDLIVTAPAFKKMNLSKKLGADEMNVFAGMLGPKFMENFIWQIDYKKEVLYVTKNKELLQLTSASYNVPFRTSMSFRAPIVTLITQEVGPREYVIDTGSPDFISDYKKIFNQALKKGKELDYVQDTINISWVNPLQKGGFVKDPGNIVKISNAKLGNMPLRETNIRFSSIAVVTIGNRFLENYIVTIDFPTKVIYLQPVLEEEKAIN